MLRFQHKVEQQQVVDDLPVDSHVGMYNVQVSSLEDDPGQGFDSQDLQWRASARASVDDKYEIGTKP